MSLHHRLRAVANTASSGGGGGSTGYAITSGTGTLFHGSSSTGTNPSTNWTNLVGGSVDDGYQLVPFGFSWTIDSTSYTGIYVGSNCYLTFGSGQTQYSSWTFASWGVPKILLNMTTDNSYQWLSYRQFGDYTRIRFEGHSSTRGTVGSGDTVYEATFFDPTKVSSKNIVEFRCGDNGRGYGYTHGIGPSNSGGANIAYASHSSLVNDSVVYEGDSTGTTWTAHVGSKMNYTVGV